MFVLGNFIEFSNGSSGRINGDLDSPKIKSIQTEFCFSFYYYMFGPVDSIQLLLISDEDGRNYNKTIWKKLFSQSDLWHRKFITIQPRKQPFKVS